MHLAEQRRKQILTDDVSLLLQYGLVIRHTCKIIRLIHKKNMQSDSEFAQIQSNNGSKHLGVIVMVVRWCQYPGRPEKRDLAAQQRGVVHQPRLQC